MSKYYIEVKDAEKEKYLTDFLLDNNIAYKKKDRAFGELRETTIRLSVKAYNEIAIAGRGIEAGDTVTVNALENCIIKFIIKP